MTFVLALLIACTFIWIGAVAAISFLEAPLKFTAPGVTLAVGLGIGRRVFQALNLAEVGLGVIAAVCVLFSHPSPWVTGCMVVAVLALLVQIAAVRPFLTKRSNAVIAAAAQGDDSQDGPRSQAHLWYVGLEIVKLVALLGLGVGALIAA